jgi:tRNA pseudouridine38-40 synthase
MRKIALRLAYDGSAYVGSQWQANGRTVQGVLEAAWMQFAQERQRFIFAGRTDAGVHAQGQVAHVISKTQHPLETIQRALNAILPDDAAVLQAWDVAEAFHARYSAQWRRYRYLIDASGAVPLPLLRQYVLFVNTPLELDAMNEALSLLHGEHDFAAFASVQEYSGPTVRHCYRAECRTVEWFDRTLIAVEVVASGFLRHMVRTLVGTVLLVGRGQMTRAEFADILASRDRSQAGATALAHGLTLMGVGYPAELFFGSLPADMQAL